MFPAMSLYDMEDGMHYACQRCGNCCRWHGEVPVTDEEDFHPVRHCPKQAAEQEDINHRRLVDDEHFSDERIRVIDLERATIKL